MKKQIDSKSYVIKFLAISMIMCVSILVGCTSIENTGDETLDLAQNFEEWEFYDIKYSLALLGDDYIIFAGKISNGENKD